MTSGYPLPLMKSPGLAPTALAVFTRAAACTQQKHAVSGMSAVYRGAVSQVNKFIAQGWGSGE